MCWKTNNPWERSHQVKDLATLRANEVAGLYEKEKELVPASRDTCALPRMFG